MYEKNTFSLMLIGIVTISLLMGCGKYSDSHEISVMNDYESISFSDIDISSNY